MLKLVICEFRKLKRKKLFRIGFLTTFIFPLFYSLIIKRNLDDMMSVVREDNGFLLLIPLSVVIAANLFFEEHDYDTLKNLMCVPVSKRRLTVAKLLVILIFDMCYQMAGYAVTILLAVIRGVSLRDWGIHLFLNLCSGILLWAAAMPCILLTLWANKSYIISVIIAFAYTVLGYIAHMSQTFVMVPLGPNIATFLPLPMIFRWLYQYHSMENAGQALKDFYERFSPYFVPTPVVFAVMLGEAAVCMALMTIVYEKQTV